MQRKDRPVDRNTSFMGQFLNINLVFMNVLLRKEDRSNKYM